MWPRRMSRSDREAAPEVQDRRVVADRDYID
ncbi:hypothetical protein CFU_0229 [Collimonas fungivorans Ter331]|uniref:Uncharacterized protein n=1 Tax=Collimonas fungivorans (strain Ter331) TaxID=1005048 RepID=G0AHM8_COLFT|nr:hypothetical protein CFU_0229 [Collimonas fungivorans Ter331]